MYGAAICIIYNSLIANSLINIIQQVSAVRNRNNGIFWKDIKKFFVNCTIIIMGVYKIPCNI